jgi:hypothetical protein
MTADVNWGDGPIHDLLAEKVAVCEERWRIGSSLPEGAISHDDVLVLRIALADARIALARWDAGYDRV